MSGRVSAVVAMAAVVAASACTPHIRVARVQRAEFAPVTTPSPSGLAGLRVHGNGVLQPALPEPPPVDCAVVTCASAGDPFAPMRLRGDAQLDGGCVWAEPLDPQFKALRVTIVWPYGTYATFGKVIRVYDVHGRLVADSRHAFVGDGSAPSDDQLPTRCLFDRTDVLGVDISTVHRLTAEERRFWHVAR